ncbi:uncharacterized protein NFIA_063640 [Aspergillus fischeri NRRL 181]|uniref:DUF7580 domain-containing protein n=1 Tax=Neosartorya fischeri (strain ATCC 1020 / DSM 3700 / CBS 544.65 / FGSC A1164 / JCM 1740 / NRRL 181 / WB 181) TaxID=331117 RepID=A1D659_NEOFI|nr:conserved hypothetical protein [Aspergillus fischeri NRRL 181]EAW21203.1 conserved hypothetical protein [Aspergillus fischeri NRRL 181]KAG2014854.1 hypothetical protein GB937_006312 [Aspergillus fischeri]
MSGLEVVGVVLGAIPLLISAIEKYKTTSQRLKFFKYKEPFIAQLIQSLEEQKFFLESDLYVPLNATHLGEEQINDLIHQPNSDLFQDPKVAHAIREYLGDGYVPYERAVGRCQRILAEIASNIGGLASESQGKLSSLIQAHPPKDGKYELTKKIKFSLQRDDLEKRIRDLNDATATLRRIRETCVSKTEVTLQSTSRMIAKFTSALNAVRNYADRLYSAISAGYNVGCHPEHETRLFLQSRSALMEKRHTGAKKTTVAFTVAFSPSNIAPSPIPCYKTDVKVLEEMESCYATAKAGEHVKVAISLPTKTNISPPKDLEDLCDSVQQARDGEHFLDLYLSQGGCLCYYHKPFNVGALVDAIADSTEDIMSLEQILGKMEQPNESSAIIRWTLNQRMALSFNIASSIMQLNSTPWLCFPLTCKSLYFTRRVELLSQRGTAQYADIPQPFIRQIFFSGVKDSARCACNPRGSMLELGIILLELWHAKTFETYAVESGLRIDHSFGSRYDVAVQWLDFSTYYVLPFYLDVVTRCIEFTFATSRAAPDWHDIAFRKSVCEYVLKPLWENCPAKFR